MDEEDRKEGEEEEGEQQKVSTEESMSLEPMGVKEWKTLWDSSPDRSFLSSPEARSVHLTMCSSANKSACVEVVWKGETPFGRITIQEHKDDFWVQVPSQQHRMICASAPEEFDWTKCERFDFTAVDGQRAHTIIFIPQLESS